MRLIDQHRTGVTPEHRGAQFSGADFACARLTVLAREALLAAGATITPAEPPQMLDQLTGAWTPSTAPHWRVQLGHRCPAGLIVTQEYGSPALCIRRQDEPEWPGGEVPAAWQQLDLTPCPTCGSALVWYEAGYVPGYRVCASPEHHHWQAQ